MDDKKIFIKPTAQIVSFINEDILSLSGELLGGENWTNDDNTEDF